jgi:hypothetical protein
MFLIDLRKIIIWKSRGITERIIQENILSLKGNVVPEFNQLQFNIDKRGGNKVTRILNLISKRGKQCSSRLTL